MTERPMRKAGGLFAEISRQFSEAVSKRSKMFNQSANYAKSLYSVSKGQSINHNDEIKIH